jgi:hypothetical protein
MRVRPFVVATLGLGIASCAARDHRPDPEAPAPTPRSSTAPPDVPCELREGRCQYWHPCGDPHETVGEGTCWDDCAARRCSPP